MKMKKIILLFILLMSIGLVQAQKIKFKKGIVYIDGKECLKYDSTDPNNVEISNLDDTQTIFLKFIRTGKGPNDGLYTKVTFVEQNKSLTSQSYIFTKKLLVKKLIKNGVLKNGEFNPAKIDKFIMRYDEKVDKKPIKILILE